LAAAFDTLNDLATTDDPMSPLRWTSKSVQALAAGFRDSGHLVSDFVVRRLLAEAGYNLQANSKTLEWTVPALVDTRLAAGSTETRRQQVWVRRVEASPRNTSSNSGSYSPGLIGVSPLITRVVAQ